MLIISPFDGKLPGSTGATLSIVVYVKLNVIFLSLLSYMCLIHNVKIFIFLAKINSLIFFPKNSEQ